MARDWTSPDPPPSGDHITDAELDRLESLGPAGAAKARRLEAWREFLDARLVEWRKLQRADLKHRPGRRKGRPERKANHMPGHWRIVLAMAPGARYRAKEVASLLSPRVTHGSAAPWLYGLLRRGVVECCGDERMWWGGWLPNRRARVYRLTPLGIRMRRFLQRTAARIAAEIAEPGEGSSMLATGKPPRKMRSGRRRRVKSRLCARG